jgi:DNA invertase Pin-like site-specific DNA recombinase
VWRLDRLGRSLPDLVRIVGELEQKGVSFESLTEKIETGSAAGKLVFHVFAALAEFERNLIRERTRAGLVAARARGRAGGRKPKLSETQIKEINEMVDAQSSPSGESPSCTASRAPPFTKSHHAGRTKRVRRSQ